MTKNQIIKNINFKFKDHLKNWGKSDSTRDQIYMEAFWERMTLEKYYIIPSEAERTFDDLTKLHIGYTIGEINDLTQKCATNNVYEAHDKPKPHIISEEEMAAVTEYYKYLYAGPRQKNENPFSMEF